MSCKMLQLLLAATAMPAAVRGQAACSDHVMLQVQHRKAHVASPDAESASSRGNFCGGFDPPEEGADLVG
eukprot:CAMPEP_0204551334 /NCGR_PEP_ID=MMETSP0661-20131031/25806_1 /ASSEMBLY_ACC=CAM_ASM_000606 /TAXON_ID=109239 /ORGANISM="Alexandrium margalefi, Strain AMGDE01CS-322" /LENGTH=69 /DNA_ID=CAMNT_0051558329 /DNA_START=52 /DNA_END=257 /DNA_ORIENTATION=+